VNEAREYNQLSVTKSIENENCERWNLFDRRSR